MYQEEKTFYVRFSLEAQFPDDYEGEDDAHAWLHDWDSRVMPEVLKSIFTTLRKFPSWSARVRNRGMAQTEEIEITLMRDYSKPVDS
ncbi:MAG: hypothetical protein JSU59_05115 [Nitrospirota bacterium]|nr:MAG: hypothetical protein JSU59_05115 [Nitrospirota bacterium]